MADEDTTAPCCSPPRPSSKEKKRAAEFGEIGDACTEDMVVIPPGVFTMGGADEDGIVQDGEGPVRSVIVDEYMVEKGTVTAQQFAEFVAVTGYVTDAERYGWSFVFVSAVHQKAFDSIREGTLSGAPWWLAVDGARWGCPYGPGSDWREYPDHPVVHISWNDANAFANASGKRLPTEAEWEKAARGTRDQSRFPWGDELQTTDQYHCNTWQGGFPDENLGLDGYLTTAPAKAYEPNAFGLYNVIGNVWEWCADGWSTNWHERVTETTRYNPKGPKNELAKVIRGGSYLCHRSYCNRYRLSARSFNAPDSSTGNTGFRCAL